MKGIFKMFVCENLDVNEKGHLTIGGVDAVDIANKYGTPLYVMDIDLVRSNCRRLNDIVNKYYGDNALLCFASKSFCCKKIYSIMQQENMGVDTVSIGEMYTAIKSGFPGKMVYFHGNNKTEDELEYAVENKIGRVVVDNFAELNSLNYIAKKKGVVANILLRLKPGVDAHVHKYVTTGSVNSKFGFDIANGEAMKAVKKATEFENVNLLGIHCHIGSQIFEVEPFLLAAEIMMNFIKSVKDETKNELLELNLGGGFGVRYLQADKSFDIDFCINSVCKLVKEKANDYGLSLPFLVFEPGRYIVAQAGVTLYTVGCRKEIDGDIIYVSVNGGMTDNPRYILYGSLYEATLANKASKEKVEKVSIAGKCCESGDLLGEGVFLQHAEKGDILAMFVTGAYNYSMASNYNRNLVPAVLFVENKECSLAIKRQTLEDLIRNDV